MRINLPDASRRSATEAGSSRAMELIGWIGTYAGPLGAVLLALNIPISPWGYVLFIISSLAMAGYGLWIADEKVVTQQVLFSVINAVGLCNWLVLPALSST